MSLREERKEALKYLFQMEWRVPGNYKNNTWQGEKKWVSFAKMENIVPYLKALEQRKESIWFFKELKYQIADSVFHPWLPTGAFVLLSKRYSNFPVEW